MTNKLFGPSGGGNKDDAEDKERPGGAPPASGIFNRSGSDKPDDKESVSKANPPFGSKPGGLFGRPGSTPAPKTGEQPRPAGSPFSGKSTGAFSRPGSTPTPKTGEQPKPAGGPFGSKSSPADRGDKPGGGVFGSRTGERPGSKPAQDKPAGGGLFSRGRPDDDKKDDDKAGGTSRLGPRADEKKDDAASGGGGIFSRFRGGKADKPDDKSGSRPGAAPARVGGAAARPGAKKDDKAPGIGGILNRLRGGKADDKDAQAKPKAAEKKEDKAGGSLWGRLGGGKPEDKSPVAPKISPAAAASRPDDRKEASKPDDRPKTGSFPRFGSGQAPAGAKPAETKQADKPAGGGGFFSRLGGGKDRDEPGSALVQAKDSKAVSALRSADAAKGAPPARLDKQARPLERSHTQVAVKNRGLSLDQKLDLIGWALLAAALVIFFGIIQPDEGTVPKAVADVLGSFFGYARFLIPIPCLLVGGWLLIRYFQENPFLEFDFLRIVGFVLLFLTVVTTLHFLELLEKVVDTWEELEAVSIYAVDMQRGGGWVGDRLYMILIRLTGEYGMAVVIAAFWVISIMLAFQITLAEVSTYFKSILSWFRRKVKGFVERRDAWIEARTARREAHMKARAEAEALKITAPTPAATTGIPAAATLTGSETVPGLGTKTLKTEPVEAQKLTPAAAQDAAEKTGPVPLGARVAADQPAGETPAEEQEAATDEAPLAAPVARPAPSPIGARPRSTPIAGKAEAPAEGRKAREEESAEDRAGQPVAAGASPVESAAKSDDEPGKPAPLAQTLLQKTTTAPDSDAAEKPGETSPPAGDLDFGTEAKPSGAKPAPLAAKLGAPFAPARPSSGLFARAGEKPDDKPATGAEEKPGGSPADETKAEPPKPSPFASRPSPFARPSSGLPKVSEQESDKPAEDIGEKPGGSPVDETKAEPPKPSPFAPRPSPFARPSSGLPKVSEQESDKPAEDIGEKPGGSSVDETKAEPPKPSPFAPRPSPFARPSSGLPSKVSEQEGDKPAEDIGEKPGSSPADEVKAEPPKPSPFARPPGGLFGKVEQSTGGEAQNEADKPTGEGETAKSGEPVTLRPPTPIPGFLGRRPEGGTGMFAKASPRPAPKPGTAEPVPDDKPPDEDELEYVPLDGEAPAEQKPPVPPPPNAAPRPVPTLPFGIRTGTAPAGAEKPGESAETGTAAPRPAETPPPGGNPHPSPVEDRSSANPGGNEAVKEPPPAPTTGASPDPALNASQADKPEPPSQEDAKPTAALTPASGAKPAETTGGTLRKHSEAGWELPDFRELLEAGSQHHIRDELLRERAATIEDTLQSFGAPGKVIEINPGPVITQFGIEPDYLVSRQGKKTRVKVSAIAKLDADLALALAARSIRIEAPVPGKGYVGIEVPNTEISLVGLRDIMADEAFQKLDSKLRIALGQSIDGASVVADLTQMPHLLIAGTTGSGKSVCVNAIISCLLLQNAPEEMQFIMVDPKRVELTGYNGIPHLVSPVVVDLERIVGVLKWVTREMDERYKRFSASGARNILDFNNRRPVGEKPMPYLIVIVDELADLMMLAPDETERVLTRLAQMARATGIHLIISTQRPSVDVVTGLIKANFPARISFAVASSVDSRVVLDQPGAEKLLGRGDMLYQAPDAAAPVRVQGVFVSDAEISRITRHWKEAQLKRREQRTLPPLSVSTFDPQDNGDARPDNGGGLPAGRAERLGSIAVSKSTSSQSEKAFFDSIRAPEPASESDMPGEDDEMYEEAVELYQKMNKISISLLQRRLRIGFTRAARLIDLMKQRGVLGAADGGTADEEDAE